MANIDRADWHYGGSYPEDLPPENGGTHIGMYLAWIIDRGLYSRSLEKHCGDALELVRTRRMTGRELLFAKLDEKLFPSLLSKAGRAFTADYYETNTYIADFAAALASDLPSAYHVEDSWANYDVIAHIVDERFRSWQAGDRPAADPGELARKAEESRYIDAILEASRQAPAEAVQLLETYAAGHPVEPYEAMALREVEILRRKHGL